MQNIRFKSGFTLVEALVALSILIVGIISGFILVTKALYDVTIIQDRLTASFLAQEGLELVRQIRDTNYLNKLKEGTGNWDDGLSDGTFTVSVNITSPPGSIILDPLAPGERRYLKYTSSSPPYLYNYDIGDETTFERTIQITHIPPDEIKIQSILTWKSRNISFEIGKGGIKAEDHLFNWLKL
jgi:type II secretory pathway pseudopilin PulG